MSDDEHIAAMEQYIQECGDRLKECRIAVGKRILTWPEVLAEVKAKTPFGIRYLEAWKEAKGDV